MTHTDPTTTAIRTLRDIIADAGDAHWTKPVALKRLRLVLDALEALRDERDRLVLAAASAEQRIASVEMAASQSTNDLVAELMQLRAQLPDSLPVDTGKKIC